MSSINDIATELNSNSKTLANKVRTHIFDFIAVGLVVAVGLLSLGAVELRDIGKEIWSILLEAVPFYLGSIALALNFYKKGVYAAKSTQTFIDTVKHYSTQISKLTGRQIQKLNDFCLNYNRRALRLRQESILRDAAISFEAFDEGITNELGVQPPLKTLTKDELTKRYGSVICCAVLKAKKVTIKGISPNNILGNMNTDDITDLGKNEQEMLKYRSTEYSVVYFASIIVMSLMGVKEILEWGWMGAFLTMFKLLYILCRSYMKYFEGFDDISVSLVNHLSRKSDVIKEFDYWFSKEIDTPDALGVGNN